MSDQPEPIAAVLADYRADIPAMTSGELPHPTPEYLRILLDRIEAAAKRERDELEASNLALADAVIAFRDYARKIENELLHCHRDLGGEISQRLVDLVTVAASLDGPEAATETARAALGAGETPTGKGVGR